MDIAKRLEIEDEPDGAAGIARMVLDGLLEGCQVVDRQFRYIYVNEAVAKQGKTSREALIGRTMMECYPGIETTEMFSRLRKCMETRTASSMDNEFTFADETNGWFDLRFEPVDDGVAILSVDVTERKRTESALKRALRALTLLSRCNQMLIRTRDEHALAQGICDVLVESGGYQSATIDLIDSLERGPNKRVSAGHPFPSSREAEACFSLEIPGNLRVVGALSLYPFDSDPSDSPERGLLQEVVMDLGYGIETQRARIQYVETEQQLIAARRLEAVGQLAGGIAHDFNNLMSVILSYSWLTMKQLPEEDPVRSDIQKMREAGERAAALTRQLLAFSSRQVLQPQVTNINHVIEGIEAMLFRLLGDDLQVEVHAVPGLGNTLIDPGQLEQVIMNLAVNARDAMPDGGKLTLETENVTLDEGYAGNHIAPEPGRYVQLSVSDNGIGMTPEIRDRIFEPFFTTKGPGSGTGLGLSTVYGIVKQSGGTIWVYSELGRGTTFKLYFPRVDAVATERKVNRQIAPSTGNELILLVEDDDSVRTATERILRTVGYRVVAASSGAEALEILQNTGQNFALLITDMTMPGMGGVELAEHVVALRAGMKVLFASGYTNQTISHHNGNATIARFLSKPFSAVELTTKVRDVLDAEPNL